MEMGRRIGLKFMLALLVVINGCADVYDKTHDYAQGWRIGEVESVGTKSTAFAISGLDCRSMADKEEDAGLRFARVQFDFSPTGEGFHHAFRHAIVLVPAAMDLKEKDWVYLNIRDCSKIIAPASFR